MGGPMGDDIRSLSGGHRPLWWSKQRPDVGAPQQCASGVKRIWLARGHIHMPLGRSQDDRRRRRSGGGLAGRASSACASAATERKTLLLAEVHAHGLAELIDFDRGPRAKDSPARHGLSGRGSCGPPAAPR